MQQWMEDIWNRKMNPNNDQLLTNEYISCCITKVKTFSNANSVIAQLENFTKCAVSEFLYFCKTIQQGVPDKKTVMKTTRSWEHSSLLGQLCVSCYIFLHDSEVLSSPFLAAKPAYVFVGRRAALRRRDGAKLICYCKGITECNSGPRCTLVPLNGQTANLEKKVFCLFFLFKGLVHLFNMGNCHHLVSPLSS